jgi:hypothetical protein
MKTDASSQRCGVDTSSDRQDSVAVTWDCRRPNDVSVGNPVRPHLAGLLLYSHAMSTRMKNLFLPLFGLSLLAPLMGIILSTQ